MAGTENPAERRQDLRVERRKRRELEREREHPLAYGYDRQHAIDEMSRGVGHAPSGAARTEAAQLAGEGDEEIRVRRRRSEREGSRERRPRSGGIPGNSSST